MKRLKIMPPPQKISIILTIFLGETKPIWPRIIFSSLFGKALSSHAYCFTFFQKKIKIARLLLWLFWQNNGHIWNLSTFFSEILCSHDCFCWLFSKKHHSFLVIICPKAIFLHSYSWLFSKPWKNAKFPTSRSYNSGPMAAFVRIFFKNKNKLVSCSCVSNYVVNSVCSLFYRCSHGFLAHKWKNLKI